jgi:uncharacterized protein
MSCVKKNYETIQSYMKAKNEAAAREFRAKYGPWTLVTGSARGIGKAYAIELASRGLNVVLVDILKGPLEMTVKEIQAKFPAVQVQGIVADLTEPAERQRVIDESQRYPIGLFCCNHAMTKLFSDGTLRTWVDTPLESLQKMIDVNLKSSVALIHYFANRMVEQKRGGMILLSSMGAISGAPYVAQYGATKAFLANLGEALSWELKNKGVDVTTVLPGLTRTDDVEKGLTDYGRKTLSMMEAHQVVVESLNALGKEYTVVPGFGNRLQHFFLSRIAPKSASIGFFGRIFPKCFHVVSNENKTN